MDEMYPTTLSEKKIQHLAEEKILNPGSGFRRRPKKPNSFGVEFSSLPRAALLSVRPPLGLNPREPDLACVNLGCPLSSRLRPIYPQLQTVSGVRLYDRT